MTSRRSSLAAGWLAGPLWLAGCVGPGPGPVVADAQPSVLPSPYTPPGPTPSPRVYSDVVPAGAFLFHDDLEHGADRWQLPAGSQPVAWRLLKAHSCGGEYTLHFGGALHAWFSGPDSESTLTLATPIDLTSARRPVLKFDVKGDATPASALMLQPELKTASGDWQALDRTLSGDNFYVRSVVIDLARWKGERISLRFRARFTAGETPTRGLYLDDIAVIEPRS